MTEIFKGVMAVHAPMFAEETGMEISYHEDLSGKNPKGRFELSGLAFRSSFENQEEAEAHAEKVRRFDAECGAILADFRYEVYDEYDPDPETQLKDRDGFYSVRGIRGPVFEDFAYRGLNVDPGDRQKIDAMCSVADRFHEQHPDYRMGVYYSPSDSVTLFPADYDGKPESLKNAVRPTKKFIAGLSESEMEEQTDLLRDFNQAANDFIYAAASGVDRSAEDDFAKAVESLNDMDDGLKI